MRYEPSTHDLSLPRNFTCPTPLVQQAHVDPAPPTHTPPPPHIHACPSPLLYSSPAPYTHVSPPSPLPPPHTHMCPRKRSMGASQKGVQGRQPATRAAAVCYSRLHTQSSRVLSQTVVQLDLRGVGLRGYDVGEVCVVQG